MNLNINLALMQRNLEICSFLLENFHLFALLSVAFNVGTFQFDSVQILI